MNYADLYRTSWEKPKRNKYRTAYLKQRHKELVARGSLLPGEHQPKVPIMDVYPIKRVRGIGPVDKKAYLLEYNRRPDVKARQLAKSRRPDVKAKRAEYRSRPENREKHRLYMKAYNKTYINRPGNREKQRQYKANYDKRLRERNLNTVARLLATDQQDTTAAAHVSDS